MFLKKSNHLNQPFTFGFPCSNFRGGFFLVQQLGSQQVLQQEASLRVDFLQMTKIRWLSIFFGLVLVCPSKTYPSKQNHGSAQRGCISNRIIIFQICSHFPLNNDYGRKINIWWCLKRGKFNDASHFSIDPCYKYHMAWKSASSTWTMRGTNIETAILYEVRCLATVSRSKHSRLQRRQPPRVRHSHLLQVNATIWIWWWFLLVGYDAELPSHSFWNNIFQKGWVTTSIVLETVSHHILLHPISTINYILQSGPLPVLSRVITLLLGVITPVAHLEGHL